jgi:hypothetical protein
MARWVVVSSGEGSSSLQGCPGSVATETHSEPRGRLLESGGWSE